MQRRSFLKLLGLTAVPLAAGIPLGREVRGAYMQLMCGGRVVAEVATDFRLNARMTVKLEVLKPISIDRMRLYPAGWDKPISDRRITLIHSVLGDTVTIRWDIKAPEGCFVGRLRPQYHRKSV